MGIFDFLKDSGRDVKEANKAQEIRNIINQALGSQLSELNVAFEDGTVRLSGRAMWHATKQKAVLLAGNIKGVSKVDDSQLVVDKSHLAGKEEKEVDEEAPLYTIQRGDSLSAIAQREYGDANAWRRIFEANREVIEDPDKIYPGQTIRIPKK